MASTQELQEELRKVHEQMGKLQQRESQIRDQLRDNLAHDHAEKLISEMPEHVRRLVRKSPRDEVQPQEARKEEATSASQE